VRVVGENQTKVNQIKQVSVFVECETEAMVNKADFIEKVSMVKCNLSVVLLAFPEKLLS
jgi:hypothetical protein